MKTFAELHNRLLGLAARLDGELWEDILKQLNPPESFPRDQAVRDLAFRDAKALAGYVPDLRKLMRDNSPAKLPKEEVAAFTAIFSLYNLAARLPVLLFAVADHKDNQNLTDVYNGYRQVLLELTAYLTLAENAPAEKDKNQT
ncbi:MAG: hypothetical protein LBF41_08290 [Deltaproteobacteria bacterium]|jgi:hypothetical protein|nr:hypothetical protein [Deltaproteobacteria bacterium]